VTTLITHPLPVLAMGLVLGSRVIPARLLLAGLFAACLPDLDVLAFRLGIAYSDAFGHRGFSHARPGDLAGAAGGRSPPKGMRPAGRAIKKLRKAVMPFT